MTFGMETARGPVCRTCHETLNALEDPIDGVCDKCNEVYAESLETDGLGEESDELIDGGGAPEAGGSWRGKIWLD